MIGIKYGKRKVVNYRGGKIVVGGLTVKNKIEILLYISKEFANTKNQKELIDRLLQLCEEIFECDNTTLRLWDGEFLQPTRFLRQTDPPRRAVQPGEGFSGKAFEDRHTMLVDDLEKMPQYLDHGEATRCVVAVPILYKEGCLGTISVEKDIPYFYKDDDKEILEAMASQLGLALNEVRLIEGLVEAQNRIESDLRMGRNVQRGIIPQSIAPWNGVQFSFYYEPMVEVSGDYFDVVRKGNSLTAIIADVSGHGVPAALVTMAIHHQFQQCVEMGMGLSEMMESLGEALRPKLPDETYFTAQVIRIYNDHTFSFVNAGHHKILHYVKFKHDFELLDSSGIPLGIARAFKDDYVEKFGRLSPGDQLVLLTDGIPEQRSPDGQQTGLQKLLDWFMEEYDGAPASEVGQVCSAVITKWKNHIGNVPKGDDLTMLLIECTPGRETAYSDFARARKEYATGNKASALELAHSAYKHDPSLHDNLYFMTKLYYKDGDFENSSRYLQEYITSSGENSAQIYSLLGNLLLRLEKVSEAKKQFKKAITQDHTYSSASMLLARCYIKENALPKAIKVLQQAVKSSPGNEKVRVALKKLERRLAEAA